MRNIIEMAFEHQDWNPVVFHKKNEQVVREVKKTVSQLEEKRMRELKDNPEGFSNRMFEKSYISEVIQKRVGKGWNQKQLATQMNLDLGIIQRFEQGKHVYDPALKDKLNRVLGIKKSLG